jgi:penicillin-binding protein 2
MKRPNPSSTRNGRRLTRRALLIGTAQFALMGGLALRMRSLQLEQAEEYRLLAEENRINIRLLPPARGLIYDREGRVVADNEQNYRIVMIREDAGDVEQVLQKLGELITLDPDRLEKAREEMARRSPFVPVTVAERVSWDEIARVTVNAPALPGIVPEVGLSRKYPYGSDLAHVIGYVGPVSDYDLNRIDDQDPLLQIPRFQIGKTGVENKLERALRGSAGTQQIEVNALGRVMRELDRREGNPGSDIQLTIDTRLQSYIEARLEGESASAIVIDVENGDLLACASAPSFDPNLFVRGISVPDWQGLNEDPYRPLAAKAVQGTYPPGSTFKMITALAAYEEGLLDPEETVFCGGFVEVSGNRFHCWKPGGHGNVNLHESLKQSCDTYYYEICQKVGIEKISEMARRFGLGIQHEVPLSAVAAGLAPDRDWKLRVRGTQWRVGDTVNVSIGQGDVLASPLQLAVMTARLATGRSVTPRLIHSIDGVETPSGRGTSLGINENALRRIRAALDDVSNQNRGTAFGSRITDQENRLAGKTGTSQVRRITQAERDAGITSNEDLPWERRDHALFVSFAPAEAPRFAVSVVVEHGGSGSGAAAPIARDVMLQALYDGTPPLSAYPQNVRARISEQQRRIDAMIASKFAASDRA